MAYLLQDPLNDAWGALNARTGKIDIPTALLFSPQSPLAAFDAAYKGWGDRYEQTFTSPSQGYVGRNLTITELEAWTAKLREQEALISRLETMYPQVVPSGGGGTVHQGSAINITGALPWWYWPVRIGAGVGVGYVVYRGLRPASGRSSVFAGLGHAMNREGLTWEDWKDEARRTHLNDRERRELQAAWRRGEDPNEHWLDDEPGPRSGQR